MVMVVLQVHVLGEKRMQRAVGREIAVLREIVRIGFQRRQMMGECRVGDDLGWREFVGGGQGVREAWLPASASSLAGASSPPPRCDAW
jgi:hypothetical protein